MTSILKVSLVGAGGGYLQRRRCGVYLPGRNRGLWRIGSRAVGLMIRPRVQMKRL